MSKTLWILVCATIIFIISIPLFAKEADSRTWEPEPQYSAAFLTWVDQLGQGENCPKKGIIDSNGKPSYGRFCYQRGTFIWFVRDLGFMPTSTDREIMAKIGDNDFQKELTIKAFEAYPNAWRHWYNTVKKIGMPPVLGITSS